MTSERHKVIETTIDGHKVHVRVQEHEDGSVSASARGDYAFAPLADDQWLLVRKDDMSHHSPAYVMKADGELRALTQGERNEFYATRKIDDPKAGWEKYEEDRKADGERAETERDKDRPEPTQPELADNSHVMIPGHDVHDDAEIDQHAPVPVHEDHEHRLMTEEERRHQVVE